MSYTKTLYPLEDVYIDENATTTGIWNSPYLILENSAAGAADQRLLLKYYLGFLPANYVISQAVFSIHLYSGSGATNAVTCYSLSEFNPFTVDWSNQPTWSDDSLDDNDILPAGGTSGADYKWWDFDVTLHVKEDETYYYLGIQSDEDSTGLDQYTFMSLTSLDEVSGGGYGIIRGESGSGTWSNGETVTGAVSGATGGLSGLNLGTVADPVLRVTSISGTFEVGEQIDGAVSSAYCDIDTISGPPPLVVTYTVVPAAVDGLELETPLNTLVDPDNVTLNFTWDEVDAEDIGYMSGLDIYYDTVASHLTGTTHTTSATALQQAIEPALRQYSEAFSITGVTTPTWYYFRIFSENTDYDDDDATGGAMLAVKLYPRPTTPALAIDDRTINVGHVSTFTNKERDKLELTGAGTSDWTVGNTVTGATSGATGVIHTIVGDQTATPTLYLTDVVGIFTVTETIDEPGAPTGTLGTYTQSSGLVEYYIDFGDDTNSGWTQTGTIKHHYSDDDTYTPKGYVKFKEGEDGAGMISAADGITDTTVVVEAGDPVGVIYGPKTSEKNETLTFNASQSYTPWGVITDYWFSTTGAFAGEQVDNGTNPVYTKQYTTAGTKTMYLRVTASDDSGVTETTTETAGDPSMQVVVGNVYVRVLQLNRSYPSNMPRDMVRDITVKNRPKATAAIGDKGHLIPVKVLEYNNVPQADAAVDVPIWEHFYDQDELELIKVEYKPSTYITGYLVSFSGPEKAAGVWDYSVKIYEVAAPAGAQEENYP